ncbi:MBL fold metallo-hydrolase [Streptacidiphilus griseoplanus]|uniref:MBL fold metallo-hydrolase n=1 Tax=Peterkaempfera griseoplana TaxID=66896 RepID=UPI00099ECF12|nr:MBL fold metallo-hydrolase [Peterkaempfera griseoplana]
MALYQLPTGTYDVRAWFAFKGGSFRDKRRFAATAVLVRHPQGDLLIDAGFGADVAAHMRTQPWFARAPYHATSTVNDQLDAVGYDRERLSGVLVTHAHWDHVGGLDQLRVPVWINPSELRYAAEDRDGRVFQAVSKEREIHQYQFEDKPYLGFPASYDVYGDGSVVVALAGGHTTGSVIVFVTLPTGKRYAFIGDLTWQLEGVTRLAERPLLLRKLADSDEEQVREGLRRIASFAGRMQVVPAHDLGSYEGIPLLSPGSTSG